MDAVRQPHALNILTSTVKFLEFLKNEKMSKIVSLICFLLYNVNVCSQSLNNDSVKQNLKPPVKYLFEEQRIRDSIIKKCSNPAPPLITDYVIDMDDWVLDTAAMSYIGIPDDMKCKIYVGKCSYANGWFGLKEGDFFSSRVFTYCTYLFSFFEFNSSYLIDFYDMNNPCKSANVINSFFVHDPTNFNINDYILFIVTKDNITIRVLAHMPEVKLSRRRKECDDNIIKEGK